MNFILLKLKWLVERNKLLVIFGIVAFSLIAFGLLFFNPFPTYRSSYDAFSSLSSKAQQGSILISKLADNSCSWVTPSYNGTNYILVIREYNSTTKDCLGELVNVTEIAIDNPANIVGTSCICGGRQYLVKKLSEGGLTNFEISIK